MKYDYEPELELPAQRRRDLCGGFPVRVAYGEWISVLQRPEVWWKHMAHINSSRTPAAVERCASELADFKPRVCSRDKVFVNGQHKRIFDTGGRALLPERLFREDRAAHDRRRGFQCLLSGQVVQCGGHGVVSLNDVNVGLAYFHTVYDTLAGLAFILDYVRRSAGAIKIVENVCIDAKGWHAGHRMNYSLMADCRGYQHRFSDHVASLLDFLGIGPGLSSSWKSDYPVQHYPYGRQVHGPSTYLDRVTFDCSSHSRSKIRHPHHVLKLRREVHARFPIIASALPEHISAERKATLIVINRNRCSSHHFRRGQDLVTGCSSARNVTAHDAIMGSLIKTFPEHHVVDFDGENMTIAEQAFLFRRAAAVVGPHGAAWSNMIFCRPGTHMVEFIAAGRSNVPTYMGYAHVFGLPWWAVISPTDRYDGIRAKAVRETLLVALGDARAARLGRREHRVTLNASFYDVGFGGCDSEAKGGRHTCHDIQHVWQ